MNLLLDTHVLLWYAEGDRNLSTDAIENLQDPLNTLFVSIATIWELAIKTSVGKLKMSVDLNTAFLALLERNGFILLSIEYLHAARVAVLPWHHRDPFDRLLVSQAEVEKMSLVSHDERLDAYGVRRIW